MTVDHGNIKERPKKATDSLELVLISKQYSVPPWGDMHTAAAVYTAAVGSMIRPAGGRRVQSKLYRKIGI